MTQPAKKRQRYPFFRVEISASEENKGVFFSKMREVQNLISKTTDKTIKNYDILTTALDFYIANFRTENEDKKQSKVPEQYVQINRESVKDETIFVASEASVKKSVEYGEHHGKICTENLKIFSQITRTGHVLSCVMRCRKGHAYRWFSSPYIEGTGNFVVNQRMLHAYFTSGMIPIQFERFSNTAGIGFFSSGQRQTFTKIFRKSVQKVFDCSIQKARFIEIGLAAGKSGEQKPVNILTDARHGWRKNAKDTSVVAIGDLSHQVLACEHVTKKDHECTQKHELIGSERIARSFSEENIAIGVWAHDYNASLNKFIRELPHQIINQNETWHGIKNLKKELSKVSQGPKYKEGVTWHPEISDKIAPTATHFQYSMRNCDGDPVKLRAKLDSIVPHYKGCHELCDPNSACKTDKNYESSCRTISDKNAEMLLQGAIKNTLIYKQPQNFCLAKDTHYVESFNNSILKFIDKRISFSDEEYLVRSQLAVLHWNENVDREFTSVNTNYMKAKKIYKKSTYKYKDHIWDIYILSL